MSMWTTMTAESEAATFTALKNNNDEEEYGESA